MVIPQVDPMPNLDRDYDLRAAFPDYHTYFADWRGRSREARDQLRCVLDVAYGLRPRERIDLFPAEGKSSPLLVFIHGGYWRSLDKSDFSFLAMPFVKRGVSLAIINYDLFPGTTMSRMVAQVRDACTWIVENAGRMSSPYQDMHLAGWSSGAHLAAMILCSRDSLSAEELPICSTLAISGVYDLRPILRTSANADLLLDDTEVRRNSPIHYPPPAITGPIALAWGGHETAEFRKQSLSLFDVWRAKGEGIVTLEVPNLHHYAIMHALADERSAVFAMACKLLCLPSA